MENSSDLDPDLWRIFQIRIRQNDSDPSDPDPDPDPPHCLKVPNCEIIFLHFAYSALKFLR